MERNSRCIKGIMKMKEDVIRGISHMRATLQRVYGLDVIKGTVKFIGWNPFGACNVVMQVDGSSFGNLGRASYGVVIWDGDGNWQEGLSRTIGVASNLEAELHGLYNGFKRLLERGVDRACCYSDSQEVIRLVKHGVDDEHVLGPIVRNIQNILESHRRFELQHIFREGNMVVDALACKGVKSEAYFTIWVFPPDEIRPLLAADRDEVLYPRL